MLKAYDLINTNFDLLASCSNQKVVFPGFLRNILRISVLKLFQEYPRNIIFCEVKISKKKFFVSYTVEFLILAVSSHRFNVFQMNFESFLFFQQFSSRGICTFIHKVRGSFLQSIDSII